MEPFSVTFMHIQIYLLFFYTCETHIIVYLLHQKEKKRNYLKSSQQWNLPSEASGVKDLLTDFALALFNLFLIFHVLMAVFAVVPYSAIEK